MSGRDLVLQVGRTLTRFRRLNLAAVLLLPLLLTAVIITAHLIGVLPPSFLLPALGMLAVLLLLFYERAGHLVERVTVEDAGRHLDQVTGAKERFITLATLSTDPDAAPLLEAIEEQAAPLAERYLAEHVERISLERPAKFSLFLSPLAAVVLGLLLTHRERLVDTPSAEATAVSLARAEAVRELVERTPDLPDSMKENLEQLASTLEERGLFSEEALKQLEQSLDGIEKLEDAADNPSNITLEEAQKIESKTTGEEKGRAKEGSEQSSNEQSAKAQQQPSDGNASMKKDRPEAEKEPSNPSPQPSPQPSQPTPPTAEQLHEQISNAQQKQQEQQPPPDPSGEEKQGAKSLQQKDDGDLKKGQKEQPQGESAKNESSEQKDGKKESAGEKGEKQGAGEQDDPKKGTAGVGDGSGEAKGKQSKGQIGGETDSGSDSSGAKEGAARNDAAGSGEGDEQGAKQGDEKGKGDASGKAGEKSGQGKSQGRNDAKGEMKPGAGDSNSTQNVKEQLEALKEEMTSGKPQPSNSGEKGQEEKQEGDTQGGQQGGQKDGSGDKQGTKQSKSDGAKGGDTSGERPGNGAKGAQPNGGDKQGGEKGGKQPGSAGGSEETPGADPKGEPKQPPSGEKGTSQGPGNKPNSGSPDGDKQSMGEGVVPKNPSGELRSKRPDALPAPSDTAPRFGPFDGGDKGDLKGKAEKVEEVSLVDNSEKIVVRSLGENDGKLYRNSANAQAKTKLGEGEFAKPKSDVAESSQPIPVEYRDILR